MTVPAYVTVSEHISSIPTRHKSSILEVISEADEVLQVQTD